MTSRLKKVSTTSRPAVLALLCPSCAGIRKCTSVGTATIGRRRKEVVQCGEPSCGLTWVPERIHVPDEKPAAA